MQINKIKVISGHQKAGEKGVGVVFFELGIDMGWGSSLWARDRTPTYVSFGKGKGLQPTFSLGYDRN